MTKLISTVQKIAIFIAYNFMLITIKLKKLSVYIANKSVLITVIRRTRRQIAVSSAIRHADKMRRQRRGRQQFVMVIGGRVKVYERDQINNLIRLGYLDKSLRDYLKLCQYCIYVTPSASDTIGKKLPKRNNGGKA